MTQLEGSREARSAATGNTWWDEAIRDLALEHHAVHHVRSLDQLQQGGKPPHLAQRGRRPSVPRYQDTFDPGGTTVEFRPRPPPHCAHKTMPLGREARGPRPVAAAHPSKHRKELDAVKKMTRTEVGSALEAWGLPRNGSLNHMRTRLKETLERAQAEAVAAARPPTKPTALSAREAVRREAVSLCLIRYTRSYSTIQPSVPTIIIRPSTSSYDTETEETCHGRQRRSPPRRVWRCGPATQTVQGWPASRALVRPLGLS